MEFAMSDESSKRCPRCDCPDGAEQCEHCKVCPHARTQPTPAGPKHLTYEELFPIVAALHRREAYARHGAGFLLPSFPDCPACGQQPAELATRSDSPDLFVRDRIALRFRPCGHTFTADGEDLYRAHDQASREQS
jgi:hypothetical protein